MDPAMLIAILVVLITIVLLVLYKRSKSARNGLLLTGLCDSGKTLIFTQLVHRSFVNTQTSIKENLGDYTTETNATLKVVDIPGYERLRYKYFDQYKHTAKVVTYVIDSSTIQKEVRDVAEYLYNILTDAVILKNTKYMMIVCNKQDIPLAKGCNAIKSILERELNTLRVTKSHQLDSVDPHAGSRVQTLGKDSQDFEFSMLPFPVEFIETSISNDKKDNGKFNELEKILLKVS